MVIVCRPLVSDSARASENPKEIFFQRPLQVFGRTIQRGEIYEAKACGTASCMGSMIKVTRGEHKAMEVEVDLTLAIDEGEGRLRIPTIAVISDYQFLLEGYLEAGVIRLDAVNQVDHSDFWMEIRAM